LGHIRCSVIKVLNFGSLNIDHVYSVSAISRPGETIQSHNYEVFAGGKGANQSAALAQAGACVSHAGRIGTDGRWLKEKLSTFAVDVNQIIEDPDSPTGHAIVQVAADGENSIVLFPGANLHLSESQIDYSISQFTQGDFLLVQNETNQIEHLLTAACRLGLKIVFNPAPFTDAVANYPLSLVDILIVNQTEANDLTALGSEASHQTLLESLHRIIGSAGEVIVTLGSEGAIFFDGKTTLFEPAITVEPVVDTTGAGDTFVGYFVAATAAGMSPTEALRKATAAAALSIARHGAMDSIPKAVDIGYME